MSILRFKAADLVRVYEHSLKAPTQMEDFSGPVDKPSICLVKDDGIYIMSNGTPRDILKGERSFCAYAKGYDPDKVDPDELWELTHSVSGDDFGETLPIDDWMAEHAKAGRDLRVTLNATTLKAESYK